MADERPSMAILLTGRSVSEAALREVPLCGIEISVAG